MILQTNLIRSIFFNGRFLTLIFLSSFACNQKEETVQDVATTGKIEIKTDETFFPIVQSQEYIFENLYRNAQIDIKIDDETEVINSFVNGKSEMIVTGRPLSKEEIDFVGKKNFSVYHTRIAMDALAVIVNKNFPDSTLDILQLQNIMNGKTKNWHDIHSSLPNEPLKVVFDKSNSSNLLFMNEKFAIKADSVNLVVAGSIPKVIEYIKNNNYCIGIVGWSWISDEEDPKTIEAMKAIKVLGIGKENAYYTPGIAEVNDSLYTFIRPIYAVNKGARAGLGSGFTSFMASDRGQRIILKSGIVPAVIPGREIELK